MSPHFKRVGSMYVVYNDKGIPIESCRSKHEAERIVYAYMRTVVKGGDDDNKDVVERSPHKGT